MSRNKYPEETVNLILDVSQRLFIEKGYDNTTIQDIIDELGGLTKGAIYHHFSSKQDILDAVIERLLQKYDCLRVGVKFNPIPVLRAERSSSVCLLQL